MSWAGLAVAGVTAVAGGVKSYISSNKKKKAQRELANMKAPFEKIQDEYFQNKNQAAEIAGQGIPSGQRDFLSDQLMVGLGGALESTKGQGGGVNAASLLLSNYNNAIKSVGAEDAETHLKNIMYFQQVNKELAGEKQTQWSVNEYQPYEAKLKELKQNIAIDEANKQEGINTMESAAISGAGSLANRLFTPKTGGTKQIRDPYDAGSGCTAPQTQQTGNMQVSSPAAAYPSLNPNAATGGIVDDPSNTSLYPVRV